MEKFEFPPELPRVGQVVQIRLDDDIYVNESKVRKRWMSRLGDEPATYWFDVVGYGHIIYNATERKWHDVTFRGKEIAVLFKPSRSLWGSGRLFIILNICILNLFRI